MRRAIAVDASLNVLHSSSRASRRSRSSQRASSSSSSPSELSGSSLRALSSSSTAAVSKNSVATDRSSACICSMVATNSSTIVDSESSQMSTC